jgi:hypothetical protein
LKFFGQNLGQLQKTKQDLKCPDYVDARHPLIENVCFGGRDESSKWIVEYRVQVIGIWVKTPN